jgi:superoxide dismutase, Fe-Mn family
MEFRIDPLPYPEDALEPVISARTLGLHYGKHHQGYLDNLRKAIEGRPEADRSLEELVRTTEGSVFNDAAQVWNHSFYWNSLKPDGGGKPSQELIDVIEPAFGSFDDMKRELAEAANSEFGSGWAWLVRDPYGRLSVEKTTDAENPLRDDLVPILTIDVWEHAYYLDYQNDRGAYVQGVIDHLLNWDFAAHNLGIPPRRA